MGNCVAQNRLLANSMNSHRSKPNKHKTVISNESAGDEETELFTNMMMIQSPAISDKGDRSANSNLVKTSPRFVSRIPVLTLPTKNRNLSKSTSFLRVSKSRIPVTQKIILSNETTHDLKNYGRPLHRSHSQLNESGFVSDFSVTNSGCSQINIEPRCEQTRQSLDVTDDLQPSTHTDLKEEELSPSDEFKISIQMRSTTCKQLSDNNVSPPSLHEEVKKTSLNSSSSISRRPQSLSCESELLIQKLHNKRLSDIGTNPSSVSPFPLLSDHNGILQDVSQLKLMLHKLKRSLLQEPLETIKQESLFRPDTPLCTDIKLISREELEQKYEKLVARNIHLERLLQSREKVIAQLQSDKVDLDNSFEVYCRSPVESNPNEFFRHKKIKSIIDIPPLQYSSNSNTLCTQPQN